MVRTLDSYAEEADEARRLLKKLFDKVAESKFGFWYAPALKAEIEEFLNNEFDVNHEIGFPEGYRDRNPL